MAGNGHASLFGKAGGQRFASPLLQLTGGKMKKLTYLIFIALLLFGLFACSEDDKPTDARILGYSLDQFIDANTVRAEITSDPEDTEDYRALFNYELVASDGFTPRQGQTGGYDLPWEILQAGYFVPSDNHSTWFPNHNLGGAFKVKNAELIRLYRKVVVSCGASSADCELLGLTVEEVENWGGEMEPAIRLNQFVSAVADYDSVRFTAPDGYVKYYNPKQIQDGYYLLNSEVTTFPSFNASMPGSQKKFKKLASVEIMGAGADPELVFALSPQDKADLSFPIPRELGSFQSTDLTDLAK